MQRQDQGTERPRHAAVGATRPRSWRWLRRRAGYVLRTEGLRSLARKAVARCLYGRVIVLELDLVGWRREISATVPLEVSELDSESLAAYLQARPDLEAADVSRRLADGHRCFVTWTNERISSAVWFGTGTMRITEIRSSIDLDPGQVYAYDSWTSPEIRGHNVAGARGVTTCETLRDAGFRGMVAYVLAGNKAGLRPPAKLGFRRMGTVGSIRLGVLRLDFTAKDGARAEWRINRPQHAWAELSDATSGSG